MPDIKQLEEQGRALLSDQKSLVDDTARNWSEKRDEYDKREADIKSIIEQVNAQKAVSGDPFAAREGATAPTEQAERRSIGAQVVDSASYKSAQSQAGGRFSTGGIDVKATFTGATGGLGLIQPQYQLDNPTNVLFRRLTVSDLMPQGALDPGARSLIYAKESTVTNAAAAVAEGTLKPASDLNVVQVTENLTKVATTLKVTDEMLKDSAATQSYIDARLTLFVRLGEEDQLLNGTGVAPNMTGLNNRTGLQAAQAKATDTATDAIFKEITKIRANAFLEPDSIVLHPTDWQSLRLLKDGQGQYYAGGPFSYGPYGNSAYQVGPTTNLDGGQTLWGLKVVVTPAQLLGTALVGAFGMAAQIFRKGGITVEMTNSNEDDFLRNLVAMRAEERLLMAVYRPGGFGQITGL